MRSEDTNKNNNFREILIEEIRFKFKEALDEQISNRKNTKTIESEIEDEETKSLQKKYGTPRKKQSIENEEFSNKLSQYIDALTPLKKDKK